MYNIRICNYMQSNYLEIVSLYIYIYIYMYINKDTRNVCMSVYVYVIYIYIYIYIYIDVYVIRREASDGRPAGRQRGSLRAAKPSGDGPTQRCVCVRIYVYV